MTTYNTGNPIGSTAVKDLYDNAQNLDVAVNDPVQTSWIDRGPSGVPRVRYTWHGIEKMVDDFLLAFGYQYIGEYEAGLTFTSRNQYTVRDGIAYKPATDAVLPLTLTGTWATDQPQLFAFNADAILRSELSDPAVGASIIAGASQTARSVAALKALPTIGASRFAQTSSFYEDIPGGGAFYYVPLVTTGLVADDWSVIEADDGGLWVLNHNGTVGVAQAGGKPGGVEDATQALSNIAAKGLNINLGQAAWLVRDAITLATSGQRVEGVGKYRSVIKVDSTFNLSATGVFVSAASGIEYENFSVLMTQPDTSVFANLTQYPPAISGLNIPGQRAKSLIVSGAIVGFDWRDNVGQSTAEDITMAAFSKGFWLDGAIDSVRFDKCHLWPAYLTTNQTLIMTQAGGATGWNVGRCDDLHVTDCLTYCATPFNFFSGVRANPGSCFGTITSCDLDGFGGITMSAGSISVIGGFQSAGQVSTPKLNISGGNLSYTGVQFQVGANFPAALFSAWMTLSGSAVVSMTSCQVYKPNDACLFILSAGKLLLTGNNFIYQPDAGFVQPIISAPAGTVIAIGNELSTLGATGTQLFFVASVDGPHVVTKNHLYGAQISAPSGIGYYSDNIQGLINKDIYNELVIGGARTKTSTVTANGSGVATWAHGIAAGNLKVLHVTAMYKGASTEAVGIPAVSVDGTNVTASAAGAAGAKVRIAITYIETSDAAW
jgi:hypothetical protein